MVSLVVGDRVPLQGSESNRPGQAYEAWSGPALPARLLAALRTPRPSLSPLRGARANSCSCPSGPSNTAPLINAAGGRGIEPRCPVLETRLIPDRYPRVSVAGTAPAASGSRNRRSSKPSSTLMRALVWNRTSISCVSNRRHHQIGFESIIVAGSLPGHGHRLLFDCQRTRPAVAGIVVGHGGLEPPSLG